MSAQVFSCVFWSVTKQLKNFLTVTFLFSSIFAFGIQIDFAQV